MCSLSPTCHPVIIYVDTSTFFASFIHFSCIWSSLTVTSTWPDFHLLFCLTLWWMVMDQPITDSILGSALRFDIWRERWPWAWQYILCIWGFSLWPHYLFIFWQISSNIWGIGFILELLDTSVGVPHQEHGAEVLRKDPMLNIKLEITGKIGNRLFAFLIIWVNIKDTNKHRNLTELKIKYKYKS